MKPIRLDGRSLTRDRMVEVAYGAQVMLDEGALRNVAHAAAFLAGARDHWVHAALMSNLCRDVGFGVLALGTLLTLGVGLFY